MKFPWQLHQLKIALYNKKKTLSSIVLYQAMFIIMLYELVEKYLDPFTVKVNVTTLYAPLHVKVLRSREKESLSSRYNCENYSLNGETDSIQTHTTFHSWLYKIPVGI